MVFLDNDRGVAIGAWGTVLKTRDGGDTWVLVDPLTSVYLKGIVHLGNDKLLLCGDQGLILTTDFSFSHADTFHAGDAYDLNTIHFLDAQKGFCAGTRGIFLTTEDGGKSWSQIIINPDYAFNDLAFPGDSTVYLSGINNNQAASLDGVLLKSTDEGRSWSLVHQDYWNFNAVSFITPLQGYICCTGGEIIKTFDGGITWGYNSLWNSAISDIFFENQQTGWCLISGDLFQTTDSGNTWNHLTRVGNTSRLIKTGRGYFAYGTGGGIYFSSNGQVPWQKQTKGINNNLIKVLFPDDRNGFILGDSILLTTHDSGNNWSQLSYPFRGLYAADFESDQSGVLFNGSGVFYTENGGVTWNTGSGFTYLTGIYDCAFAGEGTCFLTGINYGHFFANAKFFRSDDHGKNWAEIQICDGSIITDLFFLKNGTGFAAGFSGACYKTTDHGATWQKKSIESRLNSWHISFSSSTTGMIAGVYEAITGGQYARIYKTDNGGESWEMVRADTTMFGSEFSGIHMINNLKAYAAYYDGRILETLDGGMTWTEAYAGNWLSGMGGAEDAFAVGNFGTILTTNSHARISNGINWIDDKEFPVTTYPNPFSSGFTLAYSLKKDEVVTISLLDLTGKMLQSGTDKGSTGMNYYFFSGNDLAPGVYILNLSSVSFNGIGKLIKIR